MSLDADLQNIATEVRGINNPAAADRLESLRLAIQPGGDPGGWDAVDVLRAIDPSGTVAALRRQPLTSNRLARFEWLRNVLVLAPVLITWIGLKVAAEGYQAALAADESLAAQPLLLLWQQGFNGHGSWLADRLTLSTVALLDAVVIGIMIVITWSSHRELNIRQAVREQQAREIEGRLHQVAWLAALELGKRTSQAARFDQLLDEVKAERHRIGLLAKKREQGMADMQGLVDKFKDGATDFLNASSGLHQTLTGIHQTATGMEHRAGELTRREEELTKTLSSFITESQRHNKLQEASGKRLGEVVQTLTESIELMSQASTAAVGNEAKLAATVTLVQAELASLRQDLVADRKAYASASTTIQESTRTLERAGQEIAGASRRVEGLGPVIEKAANAGAALEGQIRTIAESVPTKDTLVEAGREVLQEWRQASPGGENGQTQKGGGGIFSKSWWSS